MKKAVILFACALAIAVSVGVIVEVWPKRSLIGDRNRFYAAVTSYYLRTGDLPKEASDLDKDYDGQAVPLSSFSITSIRATENGTKVEIDYLCEGREFHGGFYVRRKPANAAGG